MVVVHINENTKLTTPPWLYKHQLTFSWENRLSALSAFSISSLHNSIMLPSIGVTYVQMWKLLHRCTCNNQQLGICLVCLPLDKVLLSKPKCRQLKKILQNHIVHGSTHRHDNFPDFTRWKVSLKINTWKYWKS